MGQKALPTHMLTIPMGPGEQSGKPLLGSEAQMLTLVLQPPNLQLLPCLIPTSALEDIRENIQGHQAEKQFLEASTTPLSLAPCLCLWPGDASDLTCAT